MKKFKTIHQAKLFAKKKLSKGAFNWLIAGAEDNYTEKLNIEDLNKIKIIPKILKRTINLKLDKFFFNLKLPSPIILSPMGHQTQFHKYGEIETSKGCKEYGTLSFFSTQGRTNLDEIKSKSKNNKLVWEIFPFGDKSWIEKEIRKAEINKCLAVSFCFDANIRSHRYIDIETGYDARKHGNRTLKTSPNPSLSRNYDWDFLKWVKKKTNLVIIPKGLIDLDDIKKADKIVGKYLWISNHGGRMFNSGITPASILYKIKKKKIKLQSKIIVDGGVRRGTDIIKYLCLGADFVGIGRPAIFGLAVNGAQGVSDVFRILESELKTAMINGGFASTEDFKFLRLEK